MKLIKHAHACVVLKKGGTTLLIDPGTYNPNAAELLAQTKVVLITHEHTDHFDEAAVVVALQAQPELLVYGPKPVTDRLQAYADQVITVAEGDHLTIGDFVVDVFGSQHARVHRDLPIFVNVGYLIDSRLYHPGDAYFVPPVPVEILLLPTSGPWTKAGEAVDYAREVNPKLLIQIHDVMLSEIGQQSMARIINPKMLGPVPLTIIPVGESITV